MYSPTLGRFITTDPIGFTAGDVNLYRFVGNHPTIATDPSGLVEWPWTPKEREIWKALPKSEQSIKAGTFKIVMGRYQKGDSGGIRGTIEFEPNQNCPDCKEIKLIQILRMVRDDTETILEDTLTGTKGALNTPRPPEGFLGLGQLAAGFQPGWHVDVSAVNIKQFGKPTLYYQDNQPFLHDNQVGSSGKFQRKGKGSSILYDDPHTSLIGVRFEFETVAVCVDNGQILGSVRWGFVTLPDKNLNPMAEALPSFDGYATDNPSVNYFRAIAMFNAYYKYK